MTRRLIVSDVWACMKRVSFDLYFYVKNKFAENRIMGKTVATVLKIGHLELVYL